MNIIIALLSIIALSEIARLFLTHKKVSKKAHFKNKLEGTKRTLWDFEFKTFKTRELREDIRQEYDFMKSRITTLQQQISQVEAKNGEKRDKWSDEEKHLDDQLELATNDLNRLEDQIKALDLEINGSKATNQYPDGVQGLNSQIDALREVTELIRDYIKTL